MPIEATDVYTTIFKNATGTFMARVVGANGTPVTPAAIASAMYSVYQLNDHEPDTRVAVAGHSGVELTVADVISESVQTDAIWTRDPTGYNFRHTLDISTHAAFPTAGRRYLVEYRFVPLAGQPVFVRFRVNVI